MSKDRYIVLVDFVDLEDKNKKYKAGDKYPKPANKKITKERLLELSTNKNRRNKPLIEKVEEAQVKEEVIEEIVITDEDVKADNEK